MTAGANLLLVDDESFLRGNLTMVLERKGFTVHPASNPEEAHALFKKYPFDVAVIDVSLQLQTNGNYLVRNWFGVELGLALKEQNHRLGMVFISTQPDPGDLFWRLPATYDSIAYILKPTPRFPERLSDAIASVRRGELYIEQVRSLGTAALPNTALTPEERPIIEGIIRRIDALTSQEISIVRLLSQSMRPSRVATELGLRSVNNLLTSIYIKLGLNGEAYIREDGLHRTVLLAKAYMLYEISNKQARNANQNQNQQP